jgi:hypothetical protein
MYFYCMILCNLIVVYAFLLFVRVFLTLSMYTYVVYVFLDAATLTGGFPCFFLGCKANARV